MSQTPHISVCICTFRRPHLLERTLKELAHQDTGGLFDYSIVVADNDRAKSSERTVLDFAATSPVPVTYCVEPEQGIPFARNKAVANAKGDYVAFIDDDEFATTSWLKTLFDACQKYKVDGALGPVKPHFDHEPPRWVVKGGFYDRATYPTGLIIDWRKGRTGNTLLKSHLFQDLEQPFNPAFITGEDQDFFRRMIEKGHKFVWCNEAVAYEVVPPARCNRSFMLRRALLRGKIRLNEPTTGFRDTVKSMVAVTAYLCALPFLFLAGQHLFMSYLIKTCDHGGKLLALLGLNRMEEKYISE